MVPTICVDVRDLLRAGRGGGSAAMEVAMPKVWLQIEGWWEGGKCEVVTIVVLRHQPSTVAPGTVSQESESEKDRGESAKAEGISFDPKSSIVRFRAKDISRCVPAFLEQWERLSKVIAVAGEGKQITLYGVKKYTKTCSLSEPPQQNGILQRCQNTFLRPPHSNLTVCSRL